jgi:hypothetical protein
VPDQSYLAAVPFLLVALVYAALAPRLRLRPRALRRALDRVARRVRLLAPDQLRPRLERQLRGYRLGADLGGAAAVALIAVWGLTLGRSIVGDTWWPLIVFAGALTGAAVGSGLAVLREAARPREAPGPRIARPTSPTLRDYVAPVELHGGRVVAVLPTLLLVVLVVLSARGVAAPALIGPAVGAALALAALALGELGARRVLDAPQAAGSDLELAWSDAIRAHTLRAVVTVPIAVGTYASIGVLSVFEFRLDGVDRRSAAGVGLLALLVATLLAGTAVLVWSVTGEPHRYFRRRLWPTDRLPSHLATTGGDR